MVEHPNSRFPAQSFPSAFKLASNVSLFWKKVLDSPLPPVVRQVDIPVVIREILFPTDTGVGKFPDLLKWVFTNSLSSLQRELSCLRQPGLFFTDSLSCVLEIIFDKKKTGSSTKKSWTVHSHQFSAFKIHTSA